MLKNIKLKGISEISTEQDDSNWKSCDCSRGYAFIISVYQFKFFNTSSIEFQQNLRRSCGVTYMWSPFIVLSEIWFNLNQCGCNQNFSHNIHWKSLIEDFNRVCEKKSVGMKIQVFWDVPPSRLANSSASYCFYILRVKQSKAVLFMDVFNEAIQTQTHRQTYTHEVYTWRVKSPCAPVGSRI
jgi:hypothetical protein